MIEIALLKVLGLSPESAAIVMDEITRLRSENKRLHGALRSETAAHAEIHDWCGRNLPLSKFEGGMPSAIAKSLHALLNAREAIASCPRT
jgi:hypothetical protein